MEYLIPWIALCVIVAVTIPAIVYLYRAYKSEVKKNQMQCVRANSFFSAVARCCNMHSPHYYRFCMKYFPQQKDDHLRLLEHELVALCKAQRFDVIDKLLLCDAFTFADMQKVKQHLHRSEAWKEHCSPEKLPC